MRGLFQKAYQVWQEPSEANCRSCPVVNRKVANLHQYQVTILGKESAGIAKKMYPFSRDLAFASQTLPAPSIGSSHLSDSWHKHGRCPDLLSDKQRLGKPRAMKHATLDAQWSFEKEKRWHTSSQNLTLVGAADSPNWASFQPA